MKNSKFILISLLVLTVILSACSKPPSTTEEASGGTTDTGETYVIKVGHAASQDHFAQKSIEKFKEITEANSDGKIKVEIYPNGQLGGEREMVEAIQLGNLTIWHSLPQLLLAERFTKEMAVWDLPYLFKDHETAYKVLDGEVGQEVLDSLSDKGIKGLVYWENGFRHLTNNKHAVASVSDMKGLKMRTLESPIQIKCMVCNGCECNADCLY